MIDRARRLGKQAEVVAALSSVEESPALEMDDWADPQAMQQVMSYIEDLEPGLRNVYEQRYVRGLSQADAATTLCLTRQNIRTLEARLRDGLERKLRTKR